MTANTKMRSSCSVRGRFLALPLLIGMILGTGLANAVDPDPKVAVPTDDWKIEGNKHFSPDSSARLPSIQNTCMGDVAAENGISGLQCTANDIDIAEVSNINIIEGDPDPDDGEPECTVGEDVTFSANFKFELSAQERHDLGVWFATAGQASAQSGECLVSTAPLFKDEAGAYINDLDGTSTGVCSEDTTQKCSTDKDCRGKTNICMNQQDYCGDIDDNSSPQYFMIEITTKCVDKNGDGDLDLPVCLSWRQPGADEYCETAVDAYPGAPSKCNCDDTFSVPIKVPAPPLTVYKNISPATITEPSGKATVTFDIVNPSLYGNDVDISSIVDKLDNYVTDTNSSGTITVDDADFDMPDEELIVYKDGASSDVSDLSCVKYPETYTATPSTTSSAFDPSSDLLQAQADQLANPQTTTPNFVRCTFTRVVGGEKSGSDIGIFFDLIKVSGEDEYGATTEGEDDAELAIVDKPPKVELTKTANPTSFTEQQIADGTNSVTYTLEIKVPTDSDTVTIDCLDDKASVISAVSAYTCGTGSSLLGDETGSPTCKSLDGKTMAPGDTASCKFVRAATGISDTGDTLYDRAVVKVSDDEGGTASASDTASVTVTNSPPSLKLTKTGAPTVAGVDYEPSYSATYTYKIENITAFNDIVVLDKLEDVITLVDGTVLSSEDITNDCLDGDGKTLLTAQEAPVELAKGESFTCTLTRTVGLDNGGVPAGDAPGDGMDPGNTEDNTATVTGHEKGLTDPITAMDDESLGFKDAHPTAIVKKEVNAMTVVYKVIVSNTSAEPLDLTELMDDIGGTSVDITDSAYAPPSGLNACDVSGTFELAAKNDGDSDDYVCYFSRTFDIDKDNLTSPITDTVTAKAVDDEGNEITPSAKAQVSWVSNYVPTP